MTEMNIGLRELKARLSETMRRVKAGQTIIITDHGRPVGKIVPVDKPLDQRVEALVQAGLAFWNGNGLKPKKPVVVNSSERQISDILIEMRE